MARFWKFFSALGFITTLLVAGAAQAAPVQGVNYKLLPRPIALEHPGKIEVIEFFGYFCPHCAALEGPFSAWIAKQKKDVVVRRIPVAFREDLMPQVKLFYTLEAMGKIDTLHRKVFDAFHVDHNRLMQTSEVVSFAEKYGLDKNKFLSVYNSMAVDTKSRTAVQLFEKHSAPDIMNGVPTVIVQGRYVVSDVMGPRDTTNFQTLDYLVNEARAKHLK